MSQQTVNNGHVVFPESTDQNLDAAQANFNELYATNLAKLTSIATATTPASGTCAVQLTLKDGNGEALTTIRSGIGYLSSSVGALASAVTSVATLTNGSITQLVTGRIFHWVSKADGTLGITVTGAASTYYVSLVLPDGTVVTSSAIVVNA